MSRNRSIPWLPILLVGPWLVLEISVPPPRSELAGHLVVGTFLLAAVGVAVLFARMGIPLKWVWILASGGILGSVALALLEIGSPLVFMTFFLLVWGAIGRGLYLFWIHPRNV